MSFKSGDTTAAATSAQPAPTAEEAEEVRQLLDEEKSHIKQWRKHGLALIIISVSLVVNFLRGSRKTPSIIGITKCGTLDWSIFTIFIVSALTLSYLGVLINKRE